MPDTRSFPMILRNHRREERDKSGSGSNKIAAVTASQIRGQIVGDT